MTYSFAVLRAALRPDGCAPRRAAAAAASPCQGDEIAARFDALLRDGTTADPRPEAARRLRPVRAA